jgi:hypothetical protein
VLEVDGFLCGMNCPSDVGGSNYFRAVYCLVLCLSHILETPLEFSILFLHLPSLINSKGDVYIIFLVFCFLLSNVTIPLYME